MSQPNPNFKPSYMKTLPEHIAKSPTGITRIPNSPFPALSTPKSFQSAYERAGFDVYKPDHTSTRQNQYGGIASNHSKPSIPKNPRSQSTSELKSSAQKVVDQKRNASEYFHSGAKRDIELPPTPSSLRTPSTQKAPLSIDSNLANSSFKKSGQQQQHTSSSGSVTPHTGSTNRSAFTSTGSGGNTGNLRQHPNQQQQYSQHPPTSTTSRTFDRKTTSSVQSFQSTNQTSGHAYASNQSLPYSSQSPKRLSQNGSVHSGSTHVSRNTDNVNGRKIVSPSDLNSNYGSKDSFHSQTGNEVFYDSNNYEPMPTITQTEQEDVSLDSVKYTPARPADDYRESYLTGPNNYKMNDSTVDSDINSLTDSESLRSEILSLSPKNQHFNFEDNEKSRQSNQIDNHENKFGELSGKRTLPEETTYGEYPSEFQSTQQNTNSTNILPSFTIDSPEKDSNRDIYAFKSPIIDNQDRFSVAASSTYSVESSPNQPRTPFTSASGDEGIYSETSKGNGQQYENINSRLQENTFSAKDLQEESDDQGDYENAKSYEYQDDYDTQNTSQTVFEEIENQLDSLTMSSNLNRVENSAVTSGDDDLKNPVKIELHSVRQTTTETFEDNRNSIDAHSHSALESNLKNDTNYTTEVQEKSPIVKVPEIKEEEIYKYPPGEGPCRRCGLEIERKPIFSRTGELSGQWHRTCFTCTTCDLQFSKNIGCFVLRDEPYCDSHYHLKNNSLCKICGLGIVGKCLENDAQDRFHIDCLTCNSCQNSITSDYLSINGKVHCEPCALSYATLDTASNTIERRRTRLNFI